MTDTNRPPIQVGQTRDIKDYVSEIKEKKEKEVAEVTAELEKAKTELDTLEKRVQVLLEKLFAIETLSLENCKAFIEELKPLSKERVKLTMIIYRAEYRLKQLKYL